MRAGTLRRDARVVVALLTGLLAGTAVGGGAVYLFGGKRAAKIDVAAPALAKADELNLVPADAVAFLHFRAAETWKHPALAEIKRIADKAGPEAMKSLDESIAPAPSTLDRITVVSIRPNPPLAKEPVPNIKVGGVTPGGGDPQPPKTKGGAKGGKSPTAAPPAPPPPPQSPEIVLVLAFSAPFDANKVQQATVPSGSKKLAGTREYWHDAASDTALFIPPGQDRVLVTGSGKGVEAFALKMDVREGPLAPALKLASDGTRHIVGAMNMKDPALPDSIRESIPLDARPAFGPLFMAESVTGSLVIGSDATKLEIRLAYQSEEMAKDSETKIRANAENNRKALEEPRKKLEQAIKGKQPGQVRGIKDLPAAGAAVFALGTLNLLDDLLKDPPLTVEGKELVATIMLPSLAESSLVTSGIALTAVGFLFGELSAAVPFDRGPVPEPNDPFQPKSKGLGPVIDPPTKPKFGPEPKPQTPLPKPEPKPATDPLRDFGFDPKK